MRLAKTIPAARLLEKQQHLRYIGLQVVQPRAPDLRVPAYGAACNRSRINRPANENGAPPVSVHPVQWLLNQLARSLFVIALVSGPAMAQDALEWPQEVVAPEGTIVVYQPQPESLEGNVLKGRAAVSLELKDREEPVFGAMWFSAKIDTDREQGIALVRDVKVTKVGWPDSKDASEQRFTQLVESAIPETGFEISLERLSASLATAEVERKSLEDLKSEPPDVRFSETVAVLLLYDGEPFFSKVEGSSYERALNTPFLVVRDTKSGRHYLGSGAFFVRLGDSFATAMHKIMSTQN